MGQLPRIETDPSVCGGEARIVGTRIPVWLLVQAQRLGTTDGELLRAYPGLQAEDLASAWSFYLDHPEEIEQQIHRNETA